MATGRVPTTANSPLTVKGDLFTFSTASAKLAVGANDTALVADSTQSTGLAYKTKGVFNGLTTTGDTIYSSSGTTQARLGIGSTGQVLTVASGVPSWATPSSGGLTVIDTSTVANTSTTLTISSIPATYKHLLVVGVGLQTSGTNDGDLFVRVNGDSGNNYTLQRMHIITSTVSGYGSASISGISCMGSMARTADSAASLGEVAIYIYNYASTSNYKAIIAQGGSMNNGATTWVSSRGTWRNTAAVTSVSLVDANGTNLKAGTYITYGWN